MTSPWTQVRFNRDHSAPLIEAPPSRFGRSYVEPSPLGLSMDQLTQPVAMVGAVFAQAGDGDDLEVGTPRIRSAAMAAPYPLSMFTTQRPGAQLASMPSVTAHREYK